MAKNIGKLWKRFVSCFGLSVFFGACCLNVGGQEVEFQEPQKGVNLAKDVDSRDGVRVLLDNGYSRSPRLGDKLELTINGVDVVFYYCPAGTFLMGSLDSEKGRFRSETRHLVTLTKGFWLLETEVTQALWQAVMGENPSRFKGETLPVERISWEDCAAFVSKLNEGGFAPSGTTFDFPTEAEWEYACRAGTRTIYSFGDEFSWEKANSGGGVATGVPKDAESPRQTTPVKSYSPNAWGFYDMHGNVWEWCKDWYEGYPDEHVTDPIGLNNDARATRGGAWLFNAAGCRSASRDAWEPDYRGSHIGFRLALR